MPTLSRRFSWTLWLALLLVAPRASGQELRYQLGRRLSLCERAFAAAEPERKAVALPTLKRAVTSFFTARLQVAGEALDEARWQLEGRTPGAVERWAAAARLVPSARLVTAGEDSTTLSFELLAFYEPAIPVPPELEARVLLTAADGRILGQTDWRELGDEFALRGELVATDASPACDGVLRAELRTADGEAGSLDVGLSLVSAVRARLEACRRTLSINADLERLERATAQRLLRLLEGLLDGDVPETDYPAARLVEELESIVSLEDGERFYDWRRPGEYWLQLPVGLLGTAARIRAPRTESDAKPRPLVIALHGAGGSDNMFFEGYGDGLAVRLAEDRGWVFVAPRGPLFGSLDLPRTVEALAARYRIDRERVLIVGHSLGAARALEAAIEAPAIVAALALIGGGRPRDELGRLRGLPLFLAAGSEDFALAGVRALHEALEREAIPATFDLRTGIEHLTIVQECLPEVFRFFDDALDER